MSLRHMQDDGINGRGPACSWPTTYILVYPYICAVHVVHEMVMGIVVGEGLMVRYLSRELGRGFAVASKRKWFY